MKSPNIMYVLQLICVYIAHSMYCVTIETGGSSLLFMLVSWYIFILSFSVLPVEKLNIVYCVLPYMESGEDCFIIHAVPVSRGAVINREAECGVVTTS